MKTLVAYFSASGATKKVLGRKVIWLFALFFAYF
jgi:hypothetical protein